MILIFGEFLDVSYSQPWSSSHCQHTEICEFKIRFASNSALHTQDANSKPDGADFLRICICAQIGAADTK